MFFIESVLKMLCTRLGGMIWNRELVLDAAFITEAMHGSEMGFFEDMIGKIKVVHMCA